jgi:hypothetical protein
VNADRGFFSSPEHNGSYLNHPLARTTKEVAMNELKELSREEISQRAYQLYVQRGSEPGNDVEDWLRAEKELSLDVAVGPVKMKAAQAGS